MKKIFLYTLLSVVSLMGWGQAQLATTIDSLIATLPAESEVGIAVYDLTAREMLYTYRDNKLARPASTMKLLTTIAALSRSDGNAPFRTEVWYRGVIKGDTLKGDLYVVGGFDPEFDDEGMDYLAREVSSLPFRIIDGTIYGDVSMTDSLYWGNGWAWDDNPAAFQPYLSPLMYSKGTVTVSVVPSQVRGEMPEVLVSPRSSYYTVSNEALSRTPSAGKFSISRDWMNNSNEIVVSGNVEQRQSTEMSLYSSKDFFMHTFIQRLGERGIHALNGYAFDALVIDSLSTMAARFETPFQQVASEILKESDNLNAEALLYRTGAQASGKKEVSAKEGLEVTKQLMRRLGHNPEKYKLVDGSGLSNYNYLSPALLVDFLKYAYNDTRIFQQLYKALPMSGIDGTIKNRMKQGRAYRNVYAKTGSFTGINALAGYAKAANGHYLAFAIMNQNVLSHRQARTFQNEVCEVLCNY